MAFEEFNTQTVIESAVWVEKFRPKTFEQIKGQQKIVERVKSLVAQKNLPHLLFSGPAGVGKTTLSLVIARALYGNDYKAHFLELNASDERGIDVVRTTVKDFARTKAIGDVPFKIIYLDECDALTRDAQQALRRTMESFVATTRFILSCNYASKIIDPIQSRCTVFRFQPLAESDVKDMIQGICRTEKITVDDSAIKAIYQVSGGDGRRVNNILQSCHSVSDNITAEIVYELASMAKPAEIAEFLTIAMDGNFLEARKKLLAIMLKHGMSGTDIIRQIQRELWNLPIDDRTKVKLIDRCGEVDFRLCEGSDEFVQLEAFLAYLTLLK
jgi:replication factor C small subunit